MTTYVFVKFNIKGQNLDLFYKTGGVYSYSGDMMLLLMTKQQFFELNLPKHFIVKEITASTYNTLREGYYLSKQLFLEFQEHNLIQQILIQTQKGAHITSMFKGKNSTILCGLTTDAGAALKNYPLDPLRAVLNDDNQDFKQYLTAPTLLVGDPVILDKAFFDQNISHLNFDLIAQQTSFNKVINPFAKKKTITNVSRDAFKWGRADYDEDWIKLINHYDFLRNTIFHDIPENEISLYMQLVSKLGVKHDNNVYVGSNFTLMHTLPYSYNPTLSVIKTTRDSIIDTKLKLINQKIINKEALNLVQIVLKKN